MDSLVAVAARISEQCRCCLTGVVINLYQINDPVMYQPVNRGELKCDNTTGGDVEST